MVVWNITKCFLTTLALVLMSGLGGAWSFLASAIIVAAVYNMVSTKKK